MPVIKLKFERIKEFIDEDPETFIEWIPWIGVDIEEISEEYVKIEYNPNRPDFGALPGIMKAYKGIRGYEKGLIKYHVRSLSNKYVVNVDENIKNIRPYIASLVAKGLNIDDDLLDELIGFQEDLHMGLGRRRRKISIGIHNLDVLEFPLRYTTVNRDFKFIPLEMDKEMSISEILSKHPKGLEYGYILKDKKRYPILIDNKDMVLSFPPIINGIYTAIDSRTKNLFIDVTGIDSTLVKRALDIIGTTLEDYGAEIYSVIINDPESGTHATPEFNYSEVEVEKNEIRRILGVELDEKEIREAILAARLGIKSENKDRYTVVIPPYRIDILHPVDVIEDIAVGYGLWKIKPDLSLFFSVGEAYKESRVIDKIADFMTGLGFLEVIHSHLTNPEVMYVMMEKEADDYIEVEHPKTMLYRILRTWIIPQLLETFSISKKEEYPQKIFEIGLVFTKGNIHGSLHLAAGIAHSTANYNEVKSVLDSLMETLKIGYRIVDYKHPSFIEGRIGKIIKDNEEVGIIGEIHPKVISNFKLEVPVSMFELDLTSLIDIKSL